MKLASLKDGRDGRLVIVSRDLTRLHLSRACRAHPAAALITGHAERRLGEIAEGLERGGVSSDRFREREAASPLPRAYQWVDGSAYLNHVELVRKARGAEMPASFLSDPLMYQGGSDALIRRATRLCSPTRPGASTARLRSRSSSTTCRWASGPNPPRNHVKLLMLVNDISLRNLTGPELAKGFGFLQSKPPTAFSPVAVTPDELGEAWRDAKLHLPLLTTINGRLSGSPMPARI